MKRYSYVYIVCLFVISLFARASDEKDIKSLGAFIKYLKQVNTSNNGKLEDQNLEIVRTYWNAIYNPFKEKFSARDRNELANIEALNATFNIPSSKTPLYYKLNEITEAKIMSEFEDKKSDPNPIKAYSLLNHADEEYINKHNPCIIVRTEQHPIKLDNNNGLIDTLKTLKKTLKIRYNYCPSLLPNASQRTFFPPHTESLLPLSEKQSLIAALPQSEISFSLTASMLGYPDSMLQTVTPSNTKKDRTTPSQLRTVPNRVPPRHRKESDDSRQVTA